MNKIKNHLVFVFDLDNTLVKTNQANNLAYQEAIKSVLKEDVGIVNRRFTREDLSTLFPHLSSELKDEIIKQKEDLYSHYLQGTTLNLELFKILRLARTYGCETVLLTESRKARALQVCSYHSITNFFSNRYYKEDYGDSSKYVFLNSHIAPMSSIVLFENEQEEIVKAIQYGISENQIVTIKF